MISSPLQNRFWNKAPKELSGEISHQRLKSSYNYLWRIEGTFPWEKSIFNKDRKKSYWIFWKLYVLIPFCCHKIAPQRIQDWTFVPVFSLTMFPLGKRFTITYCRLLENIKMKENIHAICVHARSKTNFVLWLFPFLFIYLSTSQ